MSSISTKIVDLHVHSNRSDGSYTPAQLVDYALEKGLSAFALTDHDTFAGLDEAKNAALGKDIEVIAGMEFSTEYQGKDIHILGLYLDYKSPVFVENVKRFVDSRDLRNEKMCQKLQETGMDISYEKLIDMFPGAIITRSHFGKYMLEKGIIRSINIAFEKYIGDNCPYFVPREKVTPIEAIELIHQAGGVAILAHPTLYHMSDTRLATLLELLSTNGLDGMETIYCTYTKGEERQMRKLADRYHLLHSGGSDFHGTTKPRLDLATGYGNLVIPEEILIKIKERLEK